MRTHQMRSSRSSLCVALTLWSLSCLLSHTIVAQELAETAAANPEKEVSVENAAARAQALVDREAWERTILELEARDGVYGIELSEAYVGLGNTLRTLALNEEAAEAFGKALQSLRIGYGLNDLSQLPVLEQLRNTNEDLQNWEEVHTANHLMFGIVKRNAEASEELRVRTLLDLGHWTRRARAEDLVSQYEADFGDLMNLYNNEIERLEDMDDYEGKTVQLASLYLDLAGAELDEARRKYALPITAFQAPGPGEQRYTTPPTCFVVLDRSGRPGLSCTAPQTVPNMNYYLAPNMQKNTEIRQHLTVVENKVLAAYNTLSEKPAADEQHAVLLAEVRRLTTEYNKFVELNPK